MSKEKFNSISNNNLMKINLFAMLVFTYYMQRLDKFKCSILQGCNTACVWFLPSLWKTLGCFQNQCAFNIKYIAPPNDSL